MYIFIYYYLLLIIIIIIATLDNSGWLALNFLELVEGT